MSESTITASFTALTGKETDNMTADTPIATIYEEINAERMRQDAQWGGPGHDAEHTVEEWCGYIERQTQKIRHDEGRIDPRLRYIRIAALAVAAYEAFSAKSVQPSLPAEPGIYPVTLSTGERTCARWDLCTWGLWNDTVDPPEWDGVEWFNCCVVEWRTP